MRVINSQTRRDITHDYLDYVNGKISKEQFSVIASIKDISKFLNIKKQ